MGVSHFGQLHIYNGMGYLRHFGGNLKNRCQEAIQVLHICSPSPPRIWSDSDP